MNTDKASSFRRGFVAPLITEEMLVVLQYKLQMFGPPIMSPATLLCNNQGLVSNASLLQFVLVKQHNAFNYHWVSKMVAAVILEWKKE